MRLSQVMRMEGIDPAEVSIICHTPREASHRRLLPWFAAERRDLLDAYQSIQGVGAGRTLRNRPLALSFVPEPGGGRLVLAGLFGVEGGTRCTVAEMEEDPCYREMSALLEGPPSEPEGDSEAASVGDERAWLRFALTERAEMADLQGRLVIPRPGTKAFIRRTDSFDPEVIAITETSILAAAPPDWRGFILTAQEVRALPQAWEARLREWRGVYLIVDESNGARYVGSAYGGENLLGRWRAHVAGEVGVTAELRRRSPRSFRFSILELTSPTAPADEVISLEQTWMERLDTRRFGLNAGGPRDKGALAERIVNG